MNDSPANPKVVLGISASIAAYKAADLASQMVKAGIDVYPILTADAARFIGPATLEALTGHPCPVGVFEEPYPGQIAHIHLAKLADAFVVAPASMNVIAELAHGMAKEMLTAATLATKAPILIAPAMNTAMWENPATQANISQLGDWGYYFVEPATGRLACRTEGVGKLADVSEIFSAVQELLGRRRDLAGKRILITAGPTREPLDPVRYLSNRSSGKMGYALAERASLRGAVVTLVSGPVSLAPPAGVETISVETARQMEAAVLNHAPTADIVIAAAAVSDFRPDEYSDQKIKKSTHPEELKLARNPDILAGVGQIKKPGQVLIGFAAETDHLLEHAQSKLKEKNLDRIVANDITAAGAGFETDTNIVTILGHGAVRIALPKMSKHEVADRILDLLKQNK